MTLWIQIYTSYEKYACVGMYLSINIGKTYFKLTKWLIDMWITIIKHQGAVSIRKTVLPGMAIPMLKIRRPNGRLIFNMEIAIRR